MSNIAHGGDVVSEVQVAISLKVHIAVGVNSSQLLKISSGIDFKVIFIKDCKLKDRH